MLDPNKWSQFGIERVDSIKGITIHNTHSTLSASEHFALMESATDHLATHYFVDENEVVQVMPESWCVWHTGKGFDLGNMRTIAIEICRSECDLETYLAAQANAKILINELLDKYQLTKADIFFHKDFQNVYCPHKILDIYGNKKNFIRKEF